MAAADPNYVYGPKVPYVGLIPQGPLRPGDALFVKGLVPASGDNYFGINICCGLLVDGNHRDNIALHFNPRFKEKQVVFNTLINNKWGEELRRENPFVKGKPFTVRILALTHEYKVAVNGQHFGNFAHRLALGETKVVYILGQVQLDLVQFEQSGQAMTTQTGAMVPSAPGWVTEGVQQQQQAVNAPIYRPPVPFIHNLRLRPTQQFYVTGLPKVHCNDFQLNLKAGRDIAMHFSARFEGGKWSGADENVVVRNSCRNDKWETEEREAPVFPFTRGGTFDLICLVDYDGYKVAVNGQHFISFAHRMPFQSVDTLEIVGDLTLQQVHIL